MDNKILEWIFNHMFIVMAICLVLGVVLTLWAYDGDVKCLVAECRRIKK